MRFVVLMQVAASHAADTTQRVHSTVASTLTCCTSRRSTRRSDCSTSNGSNNAYTKSEVGSMPNVKEQEYKRLLESSRHTLKQVMDLDSKSDAGGGMTDGLC